MLATYFAPAGRAGVDELAAQERAAADNPIVQAILSAFDGYVLVLNLQRQILACSERLLRDIGLTGSRPVDPGPLLGLRPGEALHCVHSGEGPDGCGTGCSCRSCGAVVAILASQRGDAPADDECLLSVRDADGHAASRELSVRATPVRVGGYELTVVALRDISAVKRRAVLERAFLHDLNNTLGGIVGWSQLLEAHAARNPEEAARQVVLLCERLERELSDHRLLLMAEEGDLPVRARRVPVVGVMAALEGVFERHDVARDRVLRVEPPAGGAEVVTDPDLLLRVLTNMVKNALEAVPPGGSVRAWHERAGDADRFCVQNPGEIPAEVVGRVFHRSFSTKAASGRGIGTYSMRLLGERYLGGRVSFRSSAEEGTVFLISLPDRTG
jgi:signal transduction histidine kinase